MTAPTVTVVPAPPCPSWCRQRHEAEGWDWVGPDTGKLCRQVVPADVDRVEIEVQRAACIEDGQILIEDTEIRIMDLADDVFSPEQADAVAAAFRHAAEIARAARTLEAAAEWIGAGDGFAR